MQQYQPARQHLTWGPSGLTCLQCCALEQIRHPALPAPCSPSLPRSHNDNGCGTTNKGFSLTIPVVKDRWYYIIVSHTNTVGSPLLRLSVTKA